MSAPLFERYPDRVPDSVGVYAIFISGADEFLLSAGYESTSPWEPWTIKTYNHVYTGETYALRTRIAEHLMGSVIRSNFRHSLLALENSQAMLSGNISSPIGLNISENWLSNWLLPRTIIAFKVCNYVLDVEGDILDRSPSPLNIKRRIKTTFGAKLTKMRKDFKVLCPELFSGH